MSARIYENFNDRQFKWSNGAWYSIEGGTGMQSNDIGDSQQTWNQFTYNFPTEGKIGFYYDVQSESNYDYFQFYLDGNRVILNSGYSGRVYWERNVSKGTHIFNFGFTKDGSASRGWDGVKIVNLFVEFNAVVPHNVELDPNPLHKGNVRLTAQMVDETTGWYSDGSYKILVGGVKAYPQGAEEYSPLQPLPFDIDLRLDAHYFRTVNNTVIIETNNDLGEVSQFRYTVTKTNAVPMADVEIKGDKLYATIRDGDGDAVQYKVSLNGVTVYPENGYSDFHPSGFVGYHTLPKDVLLIGQTNTLQVDMIDEVGGVGSLTYTFTGDYAGLLFCDVLGQYYSDNIGTILKLLDMGVITSSQTSIPARVYLKNNLGMPVRKVRLWMKNIDLDETVSTPYLSFSDSPFDPQTELLFPDVIQHGEVVSFYVEVQSLLQAMHGGMFDIYVEAEPDY